MQYNAEGGGFFHTENKLVKIGKVLKHLDTRELYSIQSSTDLSLAI